MSEVIVTKRDKINMEKEDYVDEYDDTINDFPTMIKDFFNSIPWRLSIGMFILLLVLFSKQFSENILMHMGGESWVDGDCSTNKGTIVLCLIASIGLIMLDMLIKINLL